MKIIIKDENGQLAICSENEKPISESRIWQPCRWRLHPR